MVFWTAYRSIACGMQMISWKVDVTTQLRGTPIVQHLGDKMEQWLAWDFCTLFKICLLQCISVILEILLHFMFYTYWLIYGLPDDDLWKIKTCWRGNALTIKLHTTNMRLVGYDTIVLQVLLSWTSYNLLLQDYVDLHIHLVLMCKYSITWKYKSILGCINAVLKDMNAHYQQL